MAEVAVTCTVMNLAPLLIDEAKLLRNAKKEVASIKAELESIKSFLKDADSRAETGNETAKTWVNQVREVAYQIEDVIDEYILHLAERRQRRGFISFLRKVTRSIIKLKPRHDIVSKFEDIKSTIYGIKERADRYGFNSSEQGSSSNTRDSRWHEARVASLYIEDDEVLGIESPREELISRLITENTKRKVVSLIGMAGIGKTTLAKKVYDSQKLLAHFDCHAWIPVSQSYKPEELLSRMIKQFYQSRKEFIPEEIDAMDLNSLIVKLREYLLQKRYVIVFDDVWGTDLWKFMRYALPKTSRGSGIIITTRSEHVAAFCKESSLDHVHELQPLTEENAWRLFCMKAFQWDYEGCCPPELLKVSHEIVRKCEGLPLAIVAIGGLLSTKNKVIHELQKFHNSLGSELRRNLDLTSITKILLLSYHDLPYYLKSCFLYFGMLPEDYSICCGRLIRLWIAEGFIEEQRGKTLQEVGQEYLDELIHRSMVQVSETKFDGRARKCRVHDVVREIILLKAEELSFCHVLATEDSSFNDKTRRLSMHMHYSIDKVLGRTSKSRIRSISLFGVGQLPKKYLLGMLVENFKLLKVLDLEDSPLDQLHDDVGNLLHLRYLSLRNTKVKKLPRSIGKLQNLQTLDLKHSLVCELPVEIHRLHKLLRLLAYSSKNYFVNGVKIREGIVHLQELQSLLYVEVDHDALTLIKELENLRQLRKLGITNLASANGKDLCAAIEKMNYLQDLRIQALTEDEILDVHYISSPPQCLQHLNLGGRLENLPKWMLKLQNLVKLRLGWSGLTYDPLKSLQALPNLVCLGLYYACNAEQLSFEVGSFQKLKKLELIGLKAMDSMIIEEGALPRVEDIWIEDCHLLKEVPVGIHRLATLRSLVFADMPKEFLDRMRPGQGQDYWIVENIPNVRFRFKLTGSEPQIYTLREFQHAEESQQKSKAQSGSKS